MDANSGKFDDISTIDQAENVCIDAEARKHEDRSEQDRVRFDAVLYRKMGNILNQILPTMCSGCIKLHFFRSQMATRRLGSGYASMALACFMPMAYYTFWGNTRTTIYSYDRSSTWYLLLLEFSSFNVRATNEVSHKTEP